MKARRIRWTATAAVEPDGARREIVRLRLAEVLAQGLAMESGDAAALHALRIACKRLRYALELHRQAMPPEAASAERLLAHLQDALGELHDCDVLRDAALRQGALEAARIVERDRRALLTRSRRLWRDAFEERGELTELATYAGFGFPQGPGRGLP